MDDLFSTPSAVLRRFNSIHPGLEEGGGGFGAGGGYGRSPFEAPPKQPEWLAKSTPAGEAARGETRVSERVPASGEAPTARVVTDKTASTNNPAGGGRSPRATRCPTTS